MRGFAYPFRMSTGAPVAAEDEDLVAGAITQLFTQAKGERPYNRKNGLNLWQYVFENESELAKAHVRREIRLTILQFEPRAEPVSVPVRYRNQGSNRVMDIVLVWKFRDKVYSVTRAVQVEA